MAIVGPDSKNPQANIINGHEQNVPATATGAVDDLQFACIFPLTKPRDCKNGEAACDCSPNMAGNSDAVVGANSPLCQGGASINQQTYAKAYPGARELQVLKDYGDNAIVASICPKHTTSPNPSQDPNYGYNPAVGAIIERLKEALKGKCLPRPVGKDPGTGEVLCKVIEAQKEGCGNCMAQGRGPASDQIIPAVRKQLKAKGNCGGEGQDSCDTWCQCEIKPLVGSDLDLCLGDNQSPTNAGYCYVDDPTKSAGQLAKCPANEQQLLRFVPGTSAPTPTPANGAVAFIACIGNAVNEVAAP